MYSMANTVNKTVLLDVPGSPVAGTLPSSGEGGWGVWVQSPVRELRPHMSCSQKNKT